MKSVEVVGNGLHLDEVTDENLLSYMSLPDRNPSAAQAAWAEFYSRHRRYMYSVLNQICRGFLDNSAISDLVQDVFIRAYERAETFDSSGLQDPERLRYRARSWLATIAKHIFIDTLRKQAGISTIHLEKKELDEFFDAIVCIDSFFYYGTDDLYLNYLARFVKPGGQVGIVGAGLAREIEGSLPDHLQEWWTQDLWCLHSAEWWRRHWERTGIIEIELADTLPDGWQLWRDWHKAVAPNNEVEIKAVEVDGGRYLSYMRVVGRRRVDAKLEDLIVSLPAQYTKKPLLRSEG